LNLVRDGGRQLAQSCHAGKARQFDLRFPERFLELFFAAARPGGTRLRLMLVISILALLVTKSFAHDPDTAA
jgi:hypothetical protein